MAAQASRPSTLSHHALTPPLPRRRCLDGGLSRSASDPCRMNSLHSGPLPHTTAPPHRGDDLSPASLERPVNPAIAASSKAQSQSQQFAVERPPHAVDSELYLPPTPLSRSRFDRRVVPPNAPLMRIMPFGSGTNTHSLHLTLSRSRARCVSRPPPNRKELQVEKPPTTLPTTSVFLSAPLFVSAGVKTSLDITPDLITAMFVGGATRTGETLP